MLRHPGNVPALDNKTVRVVQIAAVAQGFSGTGVKARRAARLPGHDDCAARKVDGLEGVLVDQVEMEIGSLEPHSDPRIECVVEGVWLFRMHRRSSSGIHQPCNP